MQTVREKVAADYENERFKRLDAQLLRQRSLRTNKSRDEIFARLQSLRGIMAQARSDEETALRLPRLKYIQFL